MKYKRRPDEAKSKSLAAVIRNLPSTGPQAASASGVQCPRETPRQSNRSPNDGQFDSIPWHRRLDILRHVDMGDDQPLERYSRQMRFAPLGESGQRRLLAGRVAICGCGALGTVVANGLARAGVGFLRIIDRDFVELNNLQRQLLFDEDDVAANLPKSEAAARKLRRVNPQVAVEPVITDLDHTNVATLCGDVDVILDGTDNFETRFLLNDFACRERKPWIYGGCIGSQGQCMTIVPGRTGCLRCLIVSPPPPGTTPTCETAGILGSASTIIASFQIAEAIKLLSGHADAVCRDLLIIDVWDTTLKRIGLSSLPETSDCPVCRHGRFEWLDGRQQSHTVALCGRNAVQVAPPSRDAITLTALRDRLQLLTAVVANDYLVRFSLDGYDFTVFADGRAIIKGTDDVALARSLYARYVGV
jgi:adenylyltransferase/sulfurtransferase